MYSMVAWVVMIRFGHRRSARLHSAQSGWREGHRQTTPDYDSFVYSSLSTFNFQSKIPIRSGLLTSLPSTFRPSNIPTAYPPAPYPPCSQILAHSSALFCTFLHAPKTQLFSFQSFPHSLPKTTRGGRTPRFLIEEKMKPQTANSVVLIARCTHHAASGRRCR